MSPGLGYLPAAWRVAYNVVFVTLSLDRHLWSDDLASMGLHNSSSFAHERLLRVQK